MARYFLSSVFTYKRVIIFLYLDLENPVFWHLQMFLSTTKWATPIAQPGNFPPPHPTGV